MELLKKNKIEINSSDKFYLILLGIYPASLIMGNFFINLFILFFSIIFFLNIKKNKIFLKENFFYIFLFFFFSLIVNVFFSLDPLNSLPRVIKVIFIIFFVIEIKRLLQHNDRSILDYVYRTWFLILLILIFDIIFEIIVGRNIIGNTSYMEGRVATLFGDELVAGAFFHGFALFFLSYLVSKKYNNYFLICALIVIVLTSFLIGERSNFIKLFISVILFSWITLEINYKKKIFSFFLVFISLIFILSLNNDYKIRYFDQIKTLFTKNGISNYMKQSQYGAHQNAAFKIFQEYPYFGVGIKNFRNESSKSKYKNEEYTYTHLRNASHPHQTHYEILSETGMIGYLSFLFFITMSLWLSLKNYFRKRNIFQLSAIIFIFSSLLPLLPSGSFLSTFNSGIFWLNYAIMIGYISKIKS